MNTLALTKILLYPFWMRNMVCNDAIGEKAMEKVKTFTLQVKE